MPSPIESYLNELRHELRREPLLARRVLEEVADHLAEAVADGRRLGMSEHDAERDAIRRFGGAGDLARQFDTFVLPFRLLLGFASLATVGVALWLFWVIAFVLPARDPLHIPVWRVVAVCFVAYSALSWGYLLKGPRHAVLRWPVLTVSVAAVGLGFYGIVAMIRSAAAGGHFEGYIVLMGLILAGHGLCAIVYTILTGRLARRIRAV